VPDALTEHVLGAARQVITAEGRIRGNFGPAVPVVPDAHVLDRLVAFTGRAACVCPHVGPGNAYSQTRAAEPHNPEPHNPEPHNPEPHNGTGQPGTVPPNPCNPEPHNPPNF
jgi:hypothetical protein